MADASNTGSTQSFTLEAAFKKMLPNMRPELITELMGTFKNKATQDVVKKEDFEIMFQDSLGSTNPS